MVTTGSKESPTFLAVLGSTIVVLLAVAEDKELRVTTDSEPLGQLQLVRNSDLTERDRRAVLQQPG